MNAVEVRSGYKYFGKANEPNVVLNRLNMTVSYGSLYALLGPSGCGKTTLLNCIVGLRKLNDGTIKVLGGTPGTKESGIPGVRVGFMPQDISLILKFTIKEIIYYFARIYGTDIEETRSRYLFLMKLFELPDGDIYLEHCSGGQQRCVSFAASMVHEPELLILDEPTVGLDPLLREKMWNFLVSTARTKKSAIIITTHYIEEARRADRIGMMREGQLLAENAPETIISTLESETLEDAFLKLCIRQEANFEVRNDLVADQLQICNGNMNGTNNNNNISNGSCETFRKHEPKNLARNQIKALLKKNILAIYRQPASLFFIFVFPMIQILCIYAALGGDPKGLKIGVVNEELLDYKDCANQSYVTAFPQNAECYLHKVSCRYLDHLNDSVVIKYFYDNFEDAYADAKKGKIIGIIHFASNFTESLQEIRDMPRYASNGSLLNREIAVYLDSTDQRLTFFLNWKLLKTFVEFAEEIMRDCEYPIKLWNIPVEFQKPIYGGFDNEFSLFIAPAVVVTISFFLASAVTCAIFIYDRLEGLWDRTLVAGVSIEKVLLAHSIVNSVIVLIMTIEIVCIAISAYGIKNLGDNYTPIALLILLNITGMLCGLCISVACDTYRTATMITAGTFMPMITLSGVIWPIEGMPMGLRFFAQCLPFTLSSVALRNIIFKGYVFYEKSIVGSFVVTLMWLLIFFFLSKLALRLKK